MSLTSRKRKRSSTITGRVISQLFWSSESVKHPDIPLTTFAHHACIFARRTRTSDSSRGGRTRFVGEKFGRGRIAQIYLCVHAEEQQDWGESTGLLSMVRWAGEKICVCCTMTRADQGKKKIIGEKEKKKRKENDAFPGGPVLSWTS